jgi:hypothetical protein
MFVDEVEGIGLNLDEHDIEVAKGIVEGYKVEATGSRPRKLQKK